ncbi:MAG: hypothetical protein SFV22_20195 [Saprospiraceae bacterium]|nr:hypothetical protein [Saprospiraceae bacterium]
MSEMEKFERMEDYLKNRLSEAARQDFEAKMAADPALAEEVALHRDMMQATPDKDILHLRELMENAYEQWQSAQEQDEQKPETPSGWSFSMGGKLRWAAASLLIVVAVTAWWIQRKPAADFVTKPPVTHDTLPTPPPRQEEIAQKPKPDTLPAPKPAPPVYASIVQKMYATTSYDAGALMGEDVEEGENPIQKAAEAYNKSNYRETIRLLQPLPEEGRTEALKLRAHAYLRLQRYAPAAADFEALSNSFSYQNDAAWYLLLCHAARLPQTKAAYLAQYAKVSAPGHPFRSRALDLNNKLGL